MIRAFTFLTMAILGTAVIADDAPAKKTEWKKPAAPTMPSGSPKERIQTLLKQHDEQFAAYAKARSAAKNREEEAAIRKEAPDREKFVALVFQVAKENPKDAAAFDALVWVARHGKQPLGSKGGDLPAAKALALVTSDFLSNAEIGKFCRTIQRYELCPDAEAICRSVVANHENQQTRAWAAFALSTQLRQGAAMARMIQKADEKAKTTYGKLFGDDVVAKCQKEETAEAMLKEADDLLDRVVATPEFAKTPIPNRDSLTLGEMAVTLRKLSLSGL